MNLENYLAKLIKDGYLKREIVGLDKIKNLIKGAEKDLRDAKILHKAVEALKVSEEPGYNFAYNSMLKLARAILFLNHLRPNDGQQHKTTIEVAGAILGVDFRKVIVIFDRMRKKRNQFTYDPMTPISRAEARSALLTAEEFFNKVKKHLEEIDPQKKLF